MSVRCKRCGYLIRKWGDYWASYWPGEPENEQPDSWRFWCRPEERLFPVFFDPDLEHWFHEPMDPLVKIVFESMSGLEES